MQYHPQGKGKVWFKLDSDQFNKRLTILYLSTFKKVFLPFILSTDAVIIDATTIDFYKLFTQMFMYFKLIDFNTGAVHKLRRQDFEDI